MQQAVTQGQAAGFKVLSQLFSNAFPAEEDKAALISAGAEIIDYDGAPYYSYGYFCCNQPAVHGEIKAFVESDIPGPGMIGSLNATKDDRGDEYALHGDRVTARRVERWRSEENTELRAASDRMIDLMPDYCAFWGYDG